MWRVVALSVEIHKISNQIINGKLTPLKLPKVTGIALHHMANATWNVKDVEAYHVNINGWNAIGYNYWIAFDGTVYEGRGLNTGAHVTGFNSSTIGIGFQGNFQSGTKVALSVMSDAQFNAGIELISYLKSKIPTITKVGGHRDFASSACPGNTFPIAEMIAGKKREVIKVEITTVEEALDKIIAAGVDTDKVFWVKACVYDTYLDRLLIKIANAI